jgi:ADP-ribosylglycohydrolase
MGAMTGTISGAYLGSSRIPQRWLDSVREEKHTPGHVKELASFLFEKGSQLRFRKPATIKD